MRKIIPLSLVAADLDEILVSYKVSNIDDINRAVHAMMKAAIRNYFLSIPNLNEVDYLQDAIEMLENRMYLVYDEEWYGKIYRHCESLIERYFKRWDDVTWQVDNQLLTIRSHGDYRIKWFHEQNGIGRVGSETGTPLEQSGDVNDPFFVADSIDPTLDRDAYDATKYDFTQQLVETPDYLVVRGPDDRGNSHRRRS
jgi:hypothetical protein